MLLPRIVPIGDVHEEGFFHLHNVEIPETISPIRRELLLTELVRNFGKQYTVEQAAELAQHLGSFMDEAARMGLGFDRLWELVPADMSAHWQQTLEFLTIISKHWPEVLAEEGVIDPVDHRNRLLHAVSRQWQHTPPPYPVIAAGSTGSQPATAQLLATIARLPRGMVVLPGLDTAMPDKEWEATAETHPQFGLKQLLEHMECNRNTVLPLSTIHHPPSTTSRTTCLRAIFQPPDTTAGWAQALLPLAEGLTNIHLVTADTQFDEARMIAVALRETLETPGKTAALVTPDRGLALMVATQMQRFGIDLDDSAGHALMDTPTGCFLRLACEMVASRAAPSPLLSLLRHPFAAVGLEPVECRRLSRVLEIKLLRGIRRAEGMNALASAQDVPKDLQHLLAAIDELMSPFDECFRQKKVSLKKLLEIHMTFAEALAATPDESGAQRLWSGDAGNQIAAFLAELASHADTLSDIDPVSYPGLLETLMSGETYRPRFGRHPRLHILSPIEARLQHFDRVILGGLNEGTWPSMLQADPWMSRPMRSGFGLPAPERLIGQSAHDVYLLCAGPEVILTRANKIEGSPTVPSRWLVRLETLVKGLDPAYFESMRRDAWYEHGKQLLDAPIPHPPYPRPEPAPPLLARPRQLRVTAIDTWLRDPYMVYAQYILRLRKLEPLDKEPDAADFGTLVHKALELFTRRFSSELPDDGFAQLLNCGRTAFVERIDRPAVACLWWPRFEAMAQWVLEREKERRGSIAQVLSELEGRWDFDVGGKPFTLTTRIDRLEIGNDGGMAIIDYKTGTIPTQAEIDNGLANQLMLEALIASHGTLQSAIGAHAVSGLEYWKLSGNSDDCEIKNIRVEGIDEARARLENLIRAFDVLAQPYSAQNDPSKMPRFNDYKHLTRAQEWEAV